jgi:hypothetical protein
METVSRTDADEIRKLLRFRLAVPVTVQGGCMAPTLTDGQVVLVRSPRDPRAGDVALLATRDGLEIHRLLDRVRAGRRAWYLHAGDASSACGIAGEDQIVGIVPAPPRPEIPIRARLLGLALRARALVSLFTR